MPPDDEETRVFNIQDVMQPYFKGFLYKTLSSLHRDLSNKMPIPKSRYSSDAQIYKFAYQWTT